MSAPWMPDWSALMARALPIAVPEGDGFLYLVADSHLGDRRAPPGEFTAMLRGLEQPRAVVFLGDLFTVWLAPPKYREPMAQEVLAGFQSLRERGARTVFVLGNREFFLPRSPAEARSWGIPFDDIVPGAAVLSWAGRRYGFTHGDLVNRRDTQYLKWRWVSHSWAFEALFRAMPAGLARRIARRLERSMAGTNREIKIQYPEDELRAFAQAVVPGLDGFFIGHFHRDEVIAVPPTAPPSRPSPQTAGGKGPHGLDHAFTSPSPAVGGGDRGGATLRIVPDWHSRKVVLRVGEGGEVKYVRGTALEPPLHTDGRR